MFSPAVTRELKKSKCTSNAGTQLMEDDNNNNNNNNLMLAVVSILSGSIVQLLGALDSKRMTTKSQCLKQNN